MTTAHNKVFDRDVLAALKIGACFSSEGFFQGVCNDPCVWTLTKIQKGMQRYFFTVSYLGVFIGKYEAEVMPSGVVQVEAKS